MPKPAGQTNDLTSRVMDLLKIKISIPDKLTTEEVRILIHNLRASANAFNMMVEDLGLDPKNLNSPRQQTKFQQLQEHAITNNMLVEKICDSLSTERK